MLIFLQYLHTVNRLVDVRVIGVRHVVEMLSTIHKVVAVGIFVSVAVDPGAGFRVGVLNYNIVHAAGGGNIDRLGCTKKSYLLVCHINRCNLHKAAHLVVVGVGCGGICYQLAVVIVIPGSEVNGAALCRDAVHLGVHVTFNGLVLAYRTEQDARIAVSVVLVVCANVIVNVDLRCYVAIFKMNTSVRGVACGALTAGGIVLTDDTAASNVPRAPKCGDLIGVVHRNALEGYGVRGSCLGIPAYATDDTAVTDVVNAGIAVGDGDILKGCAVVGVRGDNTRSGVLTVRREVIHGQVLDRTAVDLTEQAHTVAVILKREIILAVVTLHIPGALVEVGNGVTAAVEHALKGVEVAFDGLVGSLEGSIGVVVADGIEEKIGILFCLGIVKVDVTGELYDLARKAVTRVDLRAACGVCHAADKSCECRKLVSARDIKSRCGRIVPAIVYAALPFAFAVFKYDLGEGLEVKHDVTRSGIVGVVVMFGSCTLCKGRHFHSLTVLNVVQAVVSAVQTNGKVSRKGNLDRHGVARVNAFYVYVDRDDVHAVTCRDVCLAFLNGHYRKLEGTARGFYTLGDLGGSYLALTGEEEASDDLAVVVDVNRGSLRIVGAGCVAAGEDLVVVRAEGVAFVCHLRCDQLNGEGVADGQILILVACVFAHLKREGNDSLIACLLELAHYGESAGDHVCQRTNAGFDGKIGAVAELLSGIKEIYVDRFRQDAYLAKRNDAKNVSEGKVALVYDLDMANLGITGLPLVVVEDLLVVGIFLIFHVFPLAGKSLSPIHSNIKFTGLDDIVYAGDRVGKPRVRGSQKHGKAKKQSQKTSQKECFCVFHVFLLLKNIFNLYRVGYRNYTTFSTICQDDFFKKL